MANAADFNRTLFIGDNLPILRGIDSESIDLIATDPPFNKGVKAFEGIVAAGVGRTGRKVSYNGLGYNDAESSKLEGILVFRLPTDNRALIDLLEPVKTPALVYDESRLECNLAQGLAARELAGVKLLYAVKAAALPHVLEYLSPHVDGFSVSSPFEAHLVKDLFPGATTHFTSPGIRPDEISALRAYCDFVSFNSRTQLQRHGMTLTDTASLGVRVNTGISKVSDPRYDPCRPGSKLGVPVGQIEELLVTYPRGLDGLHIHTNSDSYNYEELLENVNVLCDALPRQYVFKWVNLGGGYLLEDTPLEPLAQAVAQIKDRFDAQVYIEPGAGLVRAARLSGRERLGHFRSGRQMDCGLGHDRQPHARGLGVRLPAGCHEPSRR